MRRIASLFLLASLVFCSVGFQPTNVPNGLGVGEAIRPYNDGQVTYNLDIECDNLEVGTINVNTVDVTNITATSVSVDNISVSTIDSNYIDMGSAGEIKIGYDNSALGKLLFGGSKTAQITGGSNQPAYIYTTNGGGSSLFNSAGNIILDAPNFGGSIGFISGGEVVGGINSGGLSLLSGNILSLQSGFYTYQIGSSPDDYFYIKQSTVGNIIEGSPSKVSINVPLYVSGDIIVSQLETGEISANSLIVNGVITANQLNSIGVVSANSLIVNGTSTLNIVNASGAITGASYSGGTITGTTISGNSLVVNGNAQINGAVSDITTLGCGAITSTGLATVQGIVNNFTYKGQQGSSSVGDTNILLGGNIGSGGLTDATRKYALAMGMNHYTNAEEKIAILIGDSNGTDNKIHIGGSNGGLNSATEINFWAGANATTLTGTNVLSLKTTGATFAGAVSVSDTTESTSTTTGALKVAGGVGIAKNLNVGGKVKTADRVYQEEGTSAYDASQTLTLTTVIANTSSYLLSVIKDVSANSQTNGLYLIGRRGSANIVTAIVAIANYTVSINASDQIEILNDATSSVIHATLLRLY